MENQVILYQPNETIKVDVRLDGETVWLTQAQMSELFQRDQSTIARHIKCAFDEEELDKDTNMHFLHIASSDRPVAYYDEKPRKSARELIGYGRRFHKLRTTEEWMRELREGEDS